MFKKMRGIWTPYIKQEFIYFTCRDYSNRPLEIQRKIRNLCMEEAGHLCYCDAEAV
jgi:hypothetical protein